MNQAWRNLTKWKHLFQNVSLSYSVFKVNPFVCFALKYLWARHLTCCPCQFPVYVYSRRCWKHHTDWLSCDKLMEEGNFIKSSKAINVSKATMFLKMTQRYSLPRYHHKTNHLITFLQNFVIFRHSAQLWHPKNLGEKKAHWVSNHAPSLIPTLHNNQSSFLHPGSNEKTDTLNAENAETSKAVL